MAIELYAYGKKTNGARLHLEITSASGITAALERIDVIGTASTKVYMKAILSAAEETELDAIIDAHVDTPLPNPTQAFDDDGAVLSRPKMAPLGHNYQLYGFSFTTGKEGSLEHRAFNGLNNEGLTIRFMNIDGVEISGIENMYQVCHTQVDWTPSFSYDILGGMFHQKSVPESGMCILNVVGAPHIDKSFGGQVEFVTGVDLSFIGPDTGLHLDGESTKEVVYDPVYFSHRLGISVHCLSGMQHAMFIGLEIFKGN